MEALAELGRSTVCELVDEDEKFTRLAAYPSGCL